MKIRKMNGKGALGMSIPRAICDLYGLKEGMQIEFHPHMNDSFVVLKVRT